MRSRAAALAIATWAMSWPASSPAKAAGIPPEALAARLSPEEKVGQLFLVALDTEIAARYEPWIRSGKLGAGLLRWDRFNGEEVRAFASRMRDWAASSPAKLPFLLATDHEGGPVFTQRLYGATVFPGNMALGATGDPRLAEKAAYASARELRALGLHVDFAPVLDVNSNPDNPIIGVRSFGEDPALVSRLGLSALKGYRRGGILPVVKHFPGHGDTQVDSHLGLPAIAKTLQELELLELAPFRAALKVGAQAVMPAHIVFPALGTGPHPVTLSSAAIEGFLRRELGFSGLIFSDSLDMGAIANSTGVPGAAVLALEAGLDVLLTGKADFPPVYERVLAAVQDGRIPMARLDRSVGRILSAKRALGLFDEKPRAQDAALVGHPKHAALSREIAERSVTLLRNADSLLPLSRDDGRNLLVIVARSPRFAAEAQHFFSEISRRHGQAQFLEIPPNPDSSALQAARALANDSDVLILGSFAWGTADFKDQLSLFRQLQDLGKPAVLASLMNPYDLRHFPEARTALCAYGLTRASLEAAARVLFGELKPRGRLPVTIPGFAKRGAGL